MRLFIWADPPIEPPPGTRLARFTEWRRPWPEGRLSNAPPPPPTPPKVAPPPRLCWGWWNWPKLPVRARSLPKDEAVGEGATDWTRR